METVTKNPTRSFSGQILLMVLAALLAGGLGYVVATNMKPAAGKTSDDSKGTLSHPSSRSSSNTKEPCEDCEKLKLPSP